MLQIREVLLAILDFYLFALAKNPYPGYISRIVLTLFTQFHGRVYLFEMMCQKSFVLHMLVSSMNTHALSSQIGSFVEC